MRSDHARLRDALDHALHARDLMGVWHDGRADWSRDRQQSLLFDIAVIGTTLAKLPGTIRGLAPSIPWRDIVNTRNRVVHAYWQTDMALLSAAVTIEDLDDLSAELSQLIAQLDETQT